MSNLNRAIRQTLTIARRDFVATVFTPVFLIFLFAPVLMGVIGGSAGGFGAAAVSAGARENARVIAIVAPASAHRFTDADKRLRAIYRDEDEAPALLTTLVPTADPAAQARATLARHDIDAVAVLYGSFDRPTVLYRPSAKRAAQYLVVLAGEALAAERLGGAVPAVQATKIEVAAANGSSGAGRNQAAFFSVFGVFFLTLFLAGQMVGTMAEERNSKVIEILAAAVPLESAFLGKLVGMFGVALLFVGFWAVVLGQIASLAPAPIAAVFSGMHPAVGPAFPFLFIVYFTMAYLLLGSVFLGVGAQAQTMREIQMLSLPITIVQMAMFGLSAAAVGSPGSVLAIVAEVFPLSSPFAMAGRAAAAPELWPHVAALLWQLLWVAIFITLGARAFRRGVLQSGNAKPRRKSRQPRDPAQAY